MLLDAVLAFFDDDGCAIIDPRRFKAVGSSKDGDCISFLPVCRFGFAATPRTRRLGRPLLVSESESDLSEKVSFLADLYIVYQQ